jgi:hypothetical protein
MFSRIHSIVSDDRGSLFNDSVFAPAVRQSSGEK